MARPRSGGGGGGGGGGGAAASAANASASSSSSSSSSVNTGGGGHVTHRSRAAAPPTEPSKAAAAPAAPAAPRAGFWAALERVSSRIDDAVDRLVARYRVMEVMGLWLVMLVLDASFRIPTAWALFAILSVLTYHRAYQTNRQLLVLFVIFTVAVDALIYVLLVIQAPSAWLPVVANMVIYAYMLAVIRGTDSLSWALWLFFLAVDIFGRQLSPSETLIPLAVHCVGYGSYLILTETIGAIVDANNRPVTSRFSSLSLIFGDSEEESEVADDVVDDPVAAMASLGNTGRDIITFVGTTPIAEGLLVLSVEQLSATAVTVSWGLVLPGPFLPLAGSTMSPAYFAHVYNLLASQSSGAEPAMPDVLKVPAEMADNVEEAAERLRASAAVATVPLSEPPPLPAWMPGAAEAAAAARAASAASAAGAVSAAGLRLPGQAVPPIRDWKLSADDLLVLVDDEVLAGDRWQLVERPGPGGQPTAMLMLSRLQPDTWYRLRVVVRLPKVPCIVASYPLHFATPEAPAVSTGTDGAV